MWDVELPIAIVLGAAFALCYWLVDAAVTGVSAVDRDVLLGVGAVMALAWSLLAGSLSVQTLGGDGSLLRRTVGHVVLWTTAFTGTAILVTWTLWFPMTAVLPGAMATTLWFAMVLTATAALGGLAIALGGTYVYVSGGRGIAA